MITNPLEIIDIYEKALNPFREGVIISQEVFDYWKGRTLTIKGVERPVTMVAVTTGVYWLKVYQYTIL